MWYQAAAMVWCGVAMLVLAAIALFACAIVMRDAIITIDRKGLFVGAVYVSVAAVFIFNGLMQLI